jgi:surface antigen
MPVNFYKQSRCYTRTMKHLIKVAICVLALSSCTQPGVGPKEAGGTLVGAGVGGLIGSKFGSGTGKLVTTGLGVLLGGLMGNEVGKSLDRADQLAMTQVTLQSLNTGQPGQVFTWSNPQTGHYGTVVPLHTYTSLEGSYCREYQQTIFVGGEAQHAYGTACRQPDGSWQIIS